MQKRPVWPPLLQCIVMGSCRNPLRKPLNVAADSDGIRQVRIDGWRRSRRLSGRGCGVYCSGIGGTAAFESIEARFQRSDPLQGFLEQLRLQVELFSRDQIKTREGLSHESPHVALDVGGRATRNKLRNILLEIVDPVVPINHGLLLY